MRRIFIAIGLFAAISLSAQETETLVEDFDTQNPTLVLTRPAGMTVTTFSGMTGNCAKWPNSNGNTINMTTTSAIANVKEVRFKVKLDSSSNLYGDIIVAYSTDNRSFRQIGDAVKLTSPYKNLQTITRAIPAEVTEPIYIRISYYGDNHTYIDDITVTYEVNNCDNCFEVTF